MRPLVSLVTPVYNAMPWLRDYLSCVMEQSWRPLELILVDDGSTDGSADCIREMCTKLEAAGLAVKTLLRAHAGQAAAVNAALPHIRGEFFTWCDADDLLTPDSVEKKALWLMNHPDVGMVRSNGIVIDACNNIVLSESARAADKSSKYIFDELFCDKTYCYAGCYMLRSSLFFAGYPDRRIPESPEGQNLQLLLPAASRSICGYLDEKLHTYCRREGSHSNNRKTFQETRRRIENFTALRLAILDYCDCDREAYALRAQQVEQSAKKVLLYNAVKQAREDMRK